MSRSGGSADIPHLPSSLLMTLSRHGVMRGQRKDSGSCRNRSMNGEDCSTKAGRGMDANSSYVILRDPPLEQGEQRVDLLCRGVGALLTPGAAVSPSMRHGELPLAQ